jgi:predicted kinase
MITCGLSGSGKTWLARRVASRLGALHVRSDVERKRLAGLEAHADSRSPPDAGIYSLEFNARTYAHLYDCAAAALIAGESIVVDAAFLRHGERQQFLDLARRVEANFTIVHCRAPEAVLRQRVAARAAAKNDASEAGIDVLQRQPGYWEPFDVQQQSVVVPVDTSDPSTIDRALEQMAHRDGQ